MEDSMQQLMRRSIASRAIAENFSKADLYAYLSHAESRAQPPVICRLRLTGNIQHRTNGSRKHATEESALAIAARLAETSFASTSDPTALAQAEAMATTPRQRSARATFADVVLTSALRQSLVVSSL